MNLTHTYLQTVLQSVIKGIINHFIPTLDVTKQLCDDSSTLQY